MTKFGLHEQTDDAQLFWLEECVWRQRQWKGVTAPHAAAGNALAGTSGQRTPSARCSTTYTTPANSGTTKEANE